MSQQTFVIVGASLTGATAAAALRKGDGDARIVLIGAEQERPYERPPLSKEYLRGDPKASKPYVHDEGYYTEHDIDLRTGTRATAFDPAARTVTLEGGEQISYDALLLATGAENKHLPLTGVDLPGVVSLRTMGESEALQKAARDAGRVAVIGAGWIGSEVAASVRELGAEVAIIAPEQFPLERVLGPEVGAVYQKLQAEHGIGQHYATGVERIEGSDRATGVRTSDGELVEADLVVVGVGVRPRTELAEAAGLDVDNGVLVDEYLATSADGVYAAGDIANAWNPLLEQRIRVEHWANARSQGEWAARNMLGEHTAYQKVPYFFSDQFDLGMEYNGYAADWDRVVLRGDVEGREFLAFWLRDGRVLAGMNANIWDAGDDIKALVKPRAHVDPDRLADTSVPLSEVVQSD
jgi:3-phenylpropionate/trans-cinnamate dioxygenase ferredoxin reductase subunit